MTYEKPEARVISFDEDVIATSNCYGESGTYGDFSSCSKVVSSTHAPTTD